MPLTERIARILLSGDKRRRRTKVPHQGPFMVKGRSLQKPEITVEINTENFSRNAQIIKR